MNPSLFLSFFGAQCRFPALRSFFYSKIVLLQKWKNAVFCNWQILLENIAISALSVFRNLKVAEKSRFQMDEIPKSISNILTFFLKLIDKL